MVTDPTTVLLFGLCCAIAAGHVMTGIAGAVAGRQRMEINVVFAALTFPRAADVIAARQLLADGFGKPKADLTITRRLAEFWPETRDP